MKLKLLALALVLNSAGFSHAANLIPNGDFSLGYTGFTSDYTKVTVQNPNGPSGGMWDEGTYTLFQNPVGTHSAWQPIPGGNPYSVPLGDDLLIVNGAADTTKIVWATAASIPTSPGDTSYFFQAAVTNLFAPNQPATNGAILTFQYSYDTAPTTWITLGLPVNLASAVSGTWVVTPGTPTFQITNTNSNINLRLVNSQPAANGNDFAIGLVSLDPIAVPEPGTCALLATAGVFLMTFRRRKLAA